MSLSLLSEIDLKRGNRVIDYKALKDNNFIQLLLKVGDVICLQ